MVWTKGKSGNPGGRPKESKEVQDAARLWGTAAINRIVEIMNTVDNPQVALSAAQALLDRGYGKPHQTSSVDVTQNDVRRLGDAELDLAIASALAREKGEERHSGVTH